MWVSGKDWSEDKKRFAKQVYMIFYNLFTKLEVLYAYILKKIDTVKYHNVFYRSILSIQKCKISISSYMHFK